MERNRSQQPDTRDEVDPDVAMLLGMRPIDAGTIPTVDELDDTGEMTDTKVLEGELEARPPGSDQPDEDQAESLESITMSEARAGETDDPYEAAEEGLAWIPPTDPPMRVGDDGDLQVAAGFGTSADDEPFDADHHSSALYASDEQTARVEDALRADARTAELVDNLIVDTEGDRAVVGGVVDDIDDEDAVLEVVGAVPGIADTISRIRVRNLGPEGE